MIALLYRIRLQLEESFDFVVFYFDFRGDFRCDFCVNLSSFEVLKGVKRKLANKYFRMPQNIVIYVSL